jgi:pimeloyl-ACP methyl ester carboxylesterase
MQATAYALFLAVQAQAPAVMPNPPKPISPETALWWQDFAKDVRSVPIGGGRSLMLLCKGKGTPTVILENGTGARMLVWRTVQPVLARHYRVCAYNRAGIDGSSIGPMPRDAKAIVSDLEKLVRRARLRPPYILVGHSYGGMTMRLFARRNLSQTAGIVLVDPVAEEAFERIMPITAAFLDDYKTQLDQYRQCAAGSQSPECKISQPDDTPTSLRDRLIPRRPQEWFATMASEWESRGVLGKGTNSAQIREAGTDLMAIPLVVLTADWILRAEEIPEAQRPALQDAMIAAHKAIAAHSRRGVARLVLGSSHFIQRDKPETVIDAVDLVVSMSRR